MIFNDGINYIQSKPFIASSQLLCFIALGWFVYRSGAVIYEGFKKDHKEQGTFPVLAYMYMYLSIKYTFTFILNFGIIINSVRNEFDLKVGNIENKSFYLTLFDFIFPCVLLAFTFNFCKSFFTTNSLEFGSLNGNDYGTLFFEKSYMYSLIDFIIRLITAYLFISVEHDLSSLTSSSNLFGEIYSIGIKAFLLYGSIFLWLCYHWIFLKNYTILNRGWYRNTLFQFIGGLLLAGSLILFSSNLIHDNYKENFLMGCPMIFVGTFSVIYFIIRIEYRSLFLDGRIAVPELPKV